MATAPEIPSAAIRKSILRLSEKTPLTSSPRAVEDTTSPKEYGLVQGRRVMLMLAGIGRLKKVLSLHCKLRQSSEMVQSPEGSVDKVWFLMLLREAHIWDRVTLGGQVGGSGDGGDGEREGEAEDMEVSEDDCDGRAVEVGKVGLEDGQRPAQCM